MGTHLDCLGYVVQALDRCTTFDKTNRSKFIHRYSARIVSRVPLIWRTRETCTCCDSRDVRVFPPIVSQSREHKRKAYHHSSLSSPNRFVRTIAKQQQPRGCVRYREHYYRRRTLPSIVPGQSTGNDIFLSAVLSGASGCSYRTRDPHQAKSRVFSYVSSDASPKQQYGSQWWRPNYVETCRVIV